MRKNVIALLMLIMVLGFCSGCDDEYIKPTVTSNNRFITTGHIYYIDGDIDTRVVKDTKTDILYLLSGGSLTPFLNESGKPMRGEISE